jgi:hypothetical protein
MDGLAQSARKLMRAWQWDDSLSPLGMVIAFVNSEDNRTALRVRECDYFFRNRIARVLAKAISAMPAVWSFTITRR